MPPRETPLFDASKLTFPLAIVILIVSVAGAFYGLSARLDVISVKIDASKEIAAEQAKMRTMELDGLKLAIDALTVGLKEVRSRQDLFNLQIAEIKSTIDKQGRR